MKLAMSNLAWDPAQDKEVAFLLVEAGFQGVELAPGKYFPEFSRASQADLARLRRWWEDQGLQIVALQGVMFGKSQLNIFRHPEVTLDHFAEVLRIAQCLGAGHVVFGAPAARDPGELSPHAAREAAILFFRALARLAQYRAVTVTLEATPAGYGGRFLTTTAEVAHFVDLIDQPELRLQFDTAAVLMNGEGLHEAAQHFAANAGHRHFSAPQLAPDLDRPDLLALLPVLRRCVPDGWLSLETLVPVEDRLEVIRRLVAAVSR
ncbi:sugar phosphate isomerase/epimerase family protein [Deinococcus sp. UYEF24]